MDPEILLTTSTLAAPLSALAAIISGTFAFLSYRLARKMREELKTDERIVAGTPIHPALHEFAHSHSVVQCTLFNKSKRKAYIDSVSLYARTGAIIDATWSNEIDHLGSPQNSCQLIGIVDACSLFARRNDGERIDYARIEISHSFSKVPITVVFDPMAGLVNECTSVG